jgi:uncharacterized protein (TIGR03083 family)
MPIDVDSIFVVTDAMPHERQELLVLLGELDEADWDRPTECPSYSVKGIATHILGDDLSLLSRQRDGAVQGLVLVAETMPGADFRTLLDAFNDQWVEAARFLSPALLTELLRLSGEWSAQYHRDVDPSRPGEPVPMFGPPPGQSSPFWQAIAREFLERWAHHSQIRRALGHPSLATSPVLEVGVQIIATVAGVPAVPPASNGERWAVGPIVLGESQQAADILTLAHTEDELRSLLEGPIDLISQFSSRLGRRS